MPTLLHIRDDVVIREYQLKEGTLRIGRASGNDIQLDDSAVSSQHAVLTIQASPYMEGLMDVYVDDLDSTNGTQVNGNRIERQRLHNEDMLQTGSHIFRFVDGHQNQEGTRIYLPTEE